MKTQSERKLSLDLLRVISPLAIVLIHVSSVKYFSIGEIGYKNWIVGSALGWLVFWGVPIFIMLSGQLLLSSNKDDSIWDFYKKRYKKIFLPWLFWGGIYYLLVTNIVDYKAIDFLYRLTHGGTYSHLYFVSIMMGLYAITPLLKRWVIRWNLNILVPVLLVLSAVYHFGYSFWDWGQLDNVLVWFIPYIGVFLAGYWLTKLSAMKSSRVWLGLGAIIMFSAIFITRKLVFVFETHDQDTVLVSRLSLTVVATALILFKVFLGIENKSLEKHRKILSLSQYSFGIYLVHPLWLRIISNIGWVNEWVQKSYWLWFVGLYLAVLFMSFWTAWAFKKVPGLKLLV